MFSLRVFNEYDFIDWGISSEQKKTDRNYIHYSIIYLNERLDIKWKQNHS
jgi:hypothetical protein